MSHGVGTARGTATSWSSRSQFGNLEQAHRTFCCEARRSTSQADSEDVAPTGGVRRGPQQHPEAQRLLILTECIAAAAAVPVRQQQANNRMGASVTSATLAQLQCIKGRGSVGAGSGTGCG